MKSKSPPAPGGSPRTPTRPDRSDDEQVLWTGTASNPWLPWVLLVPFGIGALIAGVADNRVSAWGPVVLVSVLLLPVMEAFSRICVSVSRAGLTIHYGHWGWLRQRLPIARIRRADVVELSPLRHGGWGYRGSLRLLRKAAVVIRRGPALRLLLTEDRVFYVTVDDAGSAAAALMDAGVPPRQPSSPTSQLSGGPR